ncbi:MAG TPA: DUF3284 domain-containing protein [Atopostipes sp.]|nr:DUF3284 domain-containing protein [Atopostipes sp.]
MEITKTYPLTSDSLFSVIVNSFKTSYEEHSGEPLLDTDIQSGLEYVVSFGKNKEQQSKVILQQFKAPNLYETAVHSNRGKTMMRYELTEISEEQTKVTYVETTEFSDIFSKMNYYMLYFFMKRKFQKTMEQNLDFIYKEAKKSEKQEMKEHVI